jgi:hypothetical protein
MASNFRLDEVYHAGEYAQRLLNVDNPAKPEDYYLWEVIIWNPRKGHFEGPRLVLAGDADSAREQVCCAFELETWKESTQPLLADMCKNSKIERRPFMVRGWSDRTF